MNSKPSYSATGIATPGNRHRLPVYSARQTHGGAETRPAASRSCAPIVDNRTSQRDCGDRPGLSASYTTADGKGKHPHDLDHTQSSALGRKDPMSGNPRICPTVNGRKRTEQVIPDNSSVFQKEDSSHLDHVTSSQIPVTPPLRSTPSHADVEVMAATALTCLSTGSLVLNGLLGASVTTQQVTHTVPEAACRGRKASLSASYSSSTSGNWSWDTSDQSGPSTPSPPLPAGGGWHGAPSSHENTDESEPAHFLFDDPSPRKRKSSVKVMFQCLWKNCAKVLSTSSGIQKHVRSVHLGLNGDWECSEGEEDFYYTEIEVNVDSLSAGLSSLTPASPTAAPPTLTFPPSQPALELIYTPLSQSAPSAFCHIRTDHAYQATPPVGIPSRPREEFSENGMSLSWQSPPKPSKGSLGPFEETRQLIPHVTVTRTHPGTAPTPKASTGSRKLRGDARKCRKVYGMDRRDMWCTACRWKKACQRFTD